MSGLRIWSGEYMKNERSQKADYTDQFSACQDKLRSMLQKVPPGIQNWSIQKSVNFKSELKKAESLLNLKPSSRHTDFLKMEQGLAHMEKYYK